MLLSAEPVLELINADIFQEGELILDDVTFKMEKGEFVYLIGRTGCGKSSLLKTLYADLSKPKGKVTVAGVSVESIKRVKIPLLRRKIGIIFQDFQLLNDRSVADNLIFVMRATGWKNSVKIKDRLNDVLMRVGLTSSMNKMPHQLSGGEQQRVVIARALLNEPVILLADEPTGNLDPEVAEEILNLFFEINRNGTAVLMATHNHQFLLKYPARTLRVADKKVMEHAMPA
ncbi:ATP-binding cassette domain-containing protein [uncultured Cytophaga sp.]|uniref:cell division ATP-binding protein FtsE n=1 Tax=uncultured Cytophaga sp. TaxID=160238 RepID=UPI002613A31E|nr:ATP-binding cassette domain-containing protein [uncultured Cytophaga sp.]